MDAHVHDVHSFETGSRRGVEGMDVPTVACSQRIGGRLGDVVRESGKGSVSEGERGAAQLNDHCLVA
jgi:hypothetical protein